MSRRVPATRIIAIAATARSGSTLLCRALAATGQLGDPQELVNPHTVFAPGSLRRAPLLTTRLYLGLLRNWWRPGMKWEKVHRYGRAEVRAMLDDSVARWGSPDGVLCAKLMWHPYRLAMLEQGVDMSHWGAPVTWVRIQRSDRLAQAISFARARQTGQWTAEQSSSAAPSFDRLRIDRALEGIANSEAGWDGYFAQIGVTPYEIRYEDLDADYETTIRKLLDHLGCADVAVPGRQLRRQADGESEVWRERYLRESMSPAP